MAYDQSALNYIGPTKKKVKTKRVAIPKKHIDFFSGLTDEFKSNIVKTKKSGKVVAKIPRDEFYTSASQPFKGDGDKKLPSSAGEYKDAKFTHDAQKVVKGFLGVLAPTVVTVAKRIK